MLVLLSGPSGAGKSTFVKELLASDSRLEFSVSTTTRPRRKGETDGIQYHFVTEAVFDQLVAADAFVEWASVHDHRYGTRKDHLEQIRARGKLPLLDVDVQGGMRVLDLYGEKVVSVFLFPPSWAELERRLRSRGTDDEEIIQARLRNARREVGFASRYDYYVVNDNLFRALGCMRAILTADPCRRERWLEPPLRTD